LHHQHEADKELINSCAEKLAQQLEIVASKDSLIGELSDSLTDLQYTVTSLSNANKLNESNNLPNSRFLDESHYDFSNSPRLPTVDINGKQHSHNIIDDAPSPALNSRTNGYDDITVAYYKSEVSKLKAENALLHEQLVKQMVNINHQEEELRRINKSAPADMSHLESGEIARLGAELDKCIDEKEHLQAKCFRLEQFIADRDNGKAVNGASGNRLNNLASDDSSKSSVREVEQLRIEHSQTVEMYR
jgi:hypothetical protein